MAIAENLPTYRPPIPDRIRAQYEEGLSATLRWESGLLPSERKESDLEHTREMLIILEDIEQRCTILSSEINLTTVAHMIYVHDGGEILAGDLAHSHPDYLDLKPKVKKRELAAFRHLTRAIDDEAIRFLARSLFKRAQTKAPDDKEAQLTDFIDKTQAVRFGLANVFPGRNLRNSQRRTVQLNHAINALLKPGISLVRALNSPYSKTEVLGLIEEELRAFIPHGYREHEIQPYIEQLKTAL